MLSVILIKHYTFVIILPFRDQSIWFCLSDWAFPVHQIVNPFWSSQKLSIFEDPYLIDFWLWTAYWRCFLLSWRTHVWALLCQNPYFWNDEQISLLCILTTICSWYNKHKPFSSYSFLLSNQTYNTIRWSLKNSHKYQSHLLIHGDRYMLLSKVSWRVTSPIEALIVHQIFHQYWESD